MTKPILCDRCKVPIGEIDKGMVFTYDNYNVCENCGAEVCSLHCVEAEEDYWVCSECERVAKTTLDETIEIQKSLIGAGKTCDWVAEIMYKWLTELRDRREVELKPAMKFINQGFSAQLGHMRSEIKETEEAYVNYIANGCVKNRQALWDELTDLQVSAQTAKYMVFCDGDIDRDSHKRVITKNKARGYYDE